MQRGLLLQLDECLQELDDYETILLRCTAFIAINTYGHTAREIREAAEATRWKPPTAPKATDTEMVLPMTATRRWSMTNALTQSCAYVSS